MNKEHTHTNIPTPVSLSFFSVEEGPYAGLYGVIRFKEGLLHKGPDLAQAEALLSADRYWIYILHRERNLLRHDSGDLRKARMIDVEEAYAISEQDKLKYFQIREGFTPELKSREWCFVSGRGSKKPAIMYEEESGMSLSIGRCKSAACHSSLMVVKFEDPESKVPVPRTDIKYFERHYSAIV